MPEPARPPTTLFDWRQICPEDVLRPFPAVAGKGRGKPLEEAMVEAARNLRDKRLTPEEEVT